MMSTECTCCAPLAGCTQDVFGRTLPGLQQAVLLQVVLLLIMCVNKLASPTVPKYKRLAGLEFASLACLELTLCLGMFYTAAQYKQSGPGSQSQVPYACTVCIYGMRGSQLTQVAVVCKGSGACFRGPPGRGLSWFANYMQRKGFLV